MLIKKYPYYISPEDAEELCIQSGWYISSGDSFALPNDMVIPFETEQAAMEYIES